jgi:hypothetical protein
VEVGKEG